LTSRRRNNPTRDYEEQGTPPTPSLAQANTFPSIAASRSVIFEKRRENDLI
jgi:hypothetical protein